MKRYVVLATLLFAACAKHEPDEAAAEAETTPVVGASVGPAVAQRFVETVDAVGVVVVRPGHAASLAAPGPTRVARVIAVQGARVKAGDPIIEFDQTPFELAVKSADASLAAAEKAAERAQRLADAGVGTRKDAEAAVAELARARIESLSAKRALELATLRSPIAGVVTRNSALLGAGVDAGQVLVEVADVSMLDVSLTLSVSDAERVTIGQTVVFHTEADESGGVTATGRVTDVAATVDSASRGVMVRVQIGSGVDAVRIGQTLNGRVTVAEHANAVVVPIDAVVPEEENFRVFVVDGEGIAHARPVTIGGRSDDVAWVKTGLKAGERVVTQGAYGVSDGAKIESPAPAAPAAKKP